MRIVRPRAFVLVHGETTFLYAHAAMARSLGIDSLVLRNGEFLDLPSRGAAPAAGPLAGSFRGAVDLVPRWNDGPSTGDEDAMRLKERKKIAWNGLVVVDVAALRQPDGAAAIQYRPLSTECQSCHAVK